MDRRPAWHTNGQYLSNSWRLTQDSSGYLTVDSGGCSDGQMLDNAQQAARVRARESACRVPKMLVCRPSAGGGCTAKEAVVSRHFAQYNSAVSAACKPEGSWNAAVTNRKPLSAVTLRCRFTKRPPAYL